VVGGILSGVVRNIDTTFAPLLARHAEMYGNDVVLRWGNRAYSLTANGAVTNVSGDPREVLLRQASSARYFQRPDRGRGSGGWLSNRLDSNATSLRGLGAYARLAKETGDWTWETALNTRSPGYESNDYAFQRSADYLWYNANLVHFWSKRTNWYQTMVGILGGQAQQNYEGDRTGFQSQEYWSVQTRQFWNISQFLIVRPSVFDDRQLRAGPIVRTPDSRYTELDVATDSRHRVTGTLSLQYHWDHQGGRAPQVNLGANIRPVSNLSLSLGPSWSAGWLPAQYVTAVADPTATSFYGSRYVMSSIHQQTIGLDTRLSWTYSPTMSLELYMQPFLASAHYFDFKEYAAPRSAHCAYTAATSAPSIRKSGATASCRRTRSTPTQLDRPTRSRSPIQTSRKRHFAAMLSFDGSTDQDRFSTSRGHTRVHRTRASAICGLRAIARRSMTRDQTTSSLSRRAGGFRCSAATHEIRAPIFSSR
jgi:hypothetical protein